MGLNVVCVGLNVKIIIWHPGPGLKRQGLNDRGLNDIRPKQLVLPLAPALVSPQAVFPQTKAMKRRTIHNIPMHEDNGYVLKYEAALKMEIDQRYHINCICIYSLYRGICINEFYSCLLYQVTFKSVWVKQATYNERMEIVCNKLISYQFLAF